MLRTTIITLVALTCLSGCTSPTEEETLEPVAAGPTTGAISGVVVDETITPLRGANVTFLGRELRAETGPDGTFAFEDLEPGVYILEAKAPRFLAVQVTSIVKAGEVATLQVVLPRDPAPVPYNETLKFDGMWQFDQYYVHIVTLASGQDPAQCTCKFPFTVDQAPETIVMDAEWDDSRVVSDDVGWIVQGVDNEGYEQGNQDNPLQIHLPYREAFGDAGGSYEVELLPVSEATFGAEPVVNVQFTLYVTFFYIDPAPEGWSFLAQGE